MPSAGASDGDRQIGFAFLFVARQQRAEPAPQPVEKRPQAGVSLDMGGDGGIEAGEPAQLRDVMRILEKAHVEDQIRLARYAVAVGERGDEDSQRSRIER